MADASPRPPAWPAWNRSRDGDAALARYVAVDALGEAGLPVEREADEDDLAVVERLYGVLRALRLQDALEPWTPHAGVQQIRHPRRVRRERVASCGDAATTFAALCLAAHVGVLLALVDGHAFVVVTHGRLRDEPQPEERIALDGFAPVEDERDVLAGPPGALDAALRSGSLLAIDPAVAVGRDADGFEQAIASGARHAASSELRLLDVPWLQRQQGHEPYDPSREDDPLRMHVPRDPDPFVPYASHVAAIEALRDASGTVVLHAPRGLGKSRVAREIARAEPFGAAWFLDASEPEVLAKSLAEAEAVQRNRLPRAGERPDRDADAFAALGRLREQTRRWIVVLDNADGDPGALAPWMPDPSGEQLLLVTTTNRDWAQLPGVDCRELEPIAEREIAAVVGEALTPLAGGRALLVGAFERRRLLDGVAAEEVVRAGAAAAERIVAAGGELPEEVRGPLAVWAAVREAPGFDERALRVAALASFLPPDHQPLTVLEALEPGAGAAVKLLVDGGLLTCEEPGATGDRAAVRMHRLMGAAVRADVGVREPALLDEAVLRLPREPASRALLDVRGDLDAIARIEERLARLDDAASGPEPGLGVALHGIAGLLELHAQTRRSGEAYARAEHHLAASPEHRALIADCLHGRARVVYQHHGDDEARLRRAVGWAKDARRILVEEQGEDANAGRFVAMQGLLMKKLATFPPEETKPTRLREAIGVIEEADALRRAHPDVEPTELLRSQFNLAGPYITLAQMEPDHAAEHLRQALETYEAVLEARRELYERRLHPHITACISGLGYVAYYRALLVADTRMKRSQLLREATQHAHQALDERAKMEGSIDLDEAPKAAAFLAKVALARQASPAADARLLDGAVGKARRELVDARIVLPAVPPLPAEREALPAAIEAWARSAALAALVAEFGGAVPEGIELGELLAWLEDFSARWDYRKGRERNLMSVPQLAPVTQKVALAAARALGLVAPVKPKGGRYDQVLILGGLARGCLGRTKHVATLLADGKIEAGAITALGGHRELRGDELPLVERVLGRRLGDELEVLDAAARDAFGLGDPVREDGGEGWRLRDYATADGTAVRVAATPSSAPGAGRATTPDAFAWFATELAGLRPEERVLFVTTQIYLPYHHADALRKLALPYGVRVDAAGFNPGDADPALEKDFRAHEYLQEVRSAIRSLRLLHEAL